MVNIELPQLGESITDGVITAWLVQVGDDVTADQPIAEIATDKVDTEIPSPVAGTVTALLADVDQVVEVGQVIAVVGNAGSPREPVERVPPGSPPHIQPPDRPGQQPASTAADGPARRRSSPLVRSMLRSAGLELADVAATGPGCRITRQDAEAAIAARAGLAAPDTGRPAVTRQLSRTRKAIATRLWKSLQSTAQLTAAVEVDMTTIMHVRAAVKDRFRAIHGASLSPLAFTCRAVSLTLPRHPALNASFDLAAGTATYHRGINLGIAVDTDHGLLVPNIKGAQDLTVTGLATRIGDLADRARRRTLRPDEVTGGTFTITNTGSRGTLFDTPILNPPEVAILATCAIEKRPVVVSDACGDSIAIRWMSYLCLSYDHRMLDGADAARFLQDLTWVLEQHDLAGELELPVGPATDRPPPPEANRSSRAELRPEPSLSGTRRRRGI